ncbi:toxin/antitoxin system, Antitoxin component [Ligilactobacillus salitolerans]|uniref:Toxin/antitoxin system, Antitoxin component n=1 Tax=Ligilactobacillus salitolerans TaxID=1808352 RepID=A0A401IR63_9LACO|nr:helix-turn-helix domain-containing protein [Ligilactobacillus salitolerans]GBG94011.1 toxin/antitoxin system, Antitoxin component [Ligilactobacillus salitolerans]
MNKTSYDNLAAFHPGYYIKEYLADQGMNQKELADRLNTNEKTVSQLVNGKINLNAELEIGLSLALGTSQQLWHDLNQRYLKVKAEIEFQTRLDDEKDIQQQLDYKFWEKLGLVEETHQSQAKVQELRKFFKISSLDVLKSRDFLVQYRTAVAEVKDVNVINSNAWVQTALNLGNSIETEPINLAYLQDNLPVIRQMTLKTPQEFLPELRDIFQRAGVAFVILPNLKNCGVNGAVKWLGKSKVLLAMNDRRKYSDIFWFTLFHEIRHVLQKKKGHIIINGAQNSGITSSLNMAELEKDANQFAQNILIKPADYAKFVAEGDFSQATVENFAQKISIQPGIVVGRLQNDGYLNYKQMNNLKEKYTVLFQKDSTRE